MFDDAEALFLPDPDHSDDEERFVLLGLSGALRVPVVIYIDCSLRSSVGCGCG